MFIVIAIAVSVVATALIAFIFHLSISFESRFGVIASFLVSLVLVALLVMLWSQVLAL